LHYEGLKGTSLETFVHGSIGSAGGGALNEENVVIRSTSTTVKNASMLFETF
jgi:hypothetical protein